MYFRSMTPAPDGLPAIGRSARMLGVRVPQDVSPDAAGYVLPETGGMSVAPESLWNLPHHRRPRGMGRGSTGPIMDHVFSVGPESLHDNDLTARRDPKAPAIHAWIEPARKALLEHFERSLAATRSSWTRAWP
jgi:hypothetical protein